MRLPNLAPPVFRMSPSIEECCRICTMAEGYCELGLFEEAFKLVESLPPCLRSSAQSTLQRLKAHETPAPAQPVFSFA